MDKRTLAALEARTKIIKALAHPARLFMVEELHKGELCVCELQEMVGSDMSTVSKHLSILKNAGIVMDRKEGTSSYYTLKVPCILNFFQCVEEVLESNLKHNNEIILSCKKR